MAFMQFELDCTPTTQARQRHRVVRTKTGNTFVSNYKSEEQQRNEIELDALIRQFKPQVPFDGAVQLDVICYMPIPKSVSKKMKAVMETEKYPHTKKPDADNMGKNIMDCMSRARFWTDDCKVYSVRVKKFYSKNPRWDIALNGFSEDEVIDIIMSGGEML